MSRRAWGPIPLVPCVGPCFYTGIGHSCVDAAVGGVPVGPESVGSGDGSDHVQARVGDLRAFFEAGETYVASLTGIFDEIATARSAANAALSGLNTPFARVAREGYGGDVDPLAELIAEATINNAFVQTVHDSLESTSLDADGLNSAPASDVAGALRAAGLGQVGDDAGLQEDQALAADLIAIDLEEVRANLTEEQQAEVDAYQERLDNPGTSAVSVRVSEIDDPDVRLIVADMIIEDAVTRSRDPNRSQHLPLGHDPWMGLHPLVSDVAGTELQAFVAQRLFEEGTALEAEIGQIAPSQFNNERNVPQNLQETATVMVMLGLSSMNDQQRIDIVTGLEDDPAQAQLIIDALDLDNNESGNLDDYAIRGIAPVGLLERQDALATLLDAAVDDEGLINPGGEVLFEATIDRLSASGWRPRAPSAENPSSDLNAALVAIAGAPNFGLTEEEYQQALEVDRLFAELPENPTEVEWLELGVALDALGDDKTVDLILSAMSADMPAAEALRIARSAAEGPMGPYDYTPDYSPTDDRVELLRLLIGTDAMGNPPQPEDAEAGGLPVEASGSLISELRILQALQMQRWNAGRGVEAEPPLTIDQLELVADFGARFGDVNDLTEVLWQQQLDETASAGGYYSSPRPTQYQTLQAIADGELEADTELVELATRLTDPSASEVWGILLAAPDNTKFLSPDGTFGGYDPDFNTDLLAFDGYQVGEENFTALTVQLLLHDELAPTAALLSANGELITENDRENWLEENRGRIPPVLADRIRFGAGFGLGHDDWGWDELAEGLGILGLAAAVVVTIVYSGGTAAPLWVQGGLVTLAGAEAIAAIYAGDDFGAGLALFGGVADGAAFLRLLAKGRHIPPGSLLSLADNPEAWEELSGVDRIRAYESIVADARGSSVPGMRELAEQAGDLEPAEFLTRYHRIAADNPEAYLAQIEDPVKRAIARRQLGFDDVAASTASLTAAPAGAPSWVIGHHPNDPPNVFRASDGKAAIRHPVTGEWTVPQGLDVQKGSFGEYVGTHNMEGLGHTPILRRIGLGDDTTAPGIDQIYQNANPPPSLIVAETKYRTHGPFDPANFPTPSIGTQMSEDWIEAHAETLFNDGIIDRATYRQLVNGDYVPVLQRVDPSGNVENINLETGDPL